MAARFGGALGGLLGNSTLEQIVLFGIGQQVIGAAIAPYVQALQQESFFLAPTILKGRTAMRACIVNFRTTREDLTFLQDETARAGRDLLEEARS